MKLYYNPVSTYSQKVMMALYEKGIEFQPEIVNLMDGEARQAYRKIYPLGKIPLLVLDDGQVIPESSNIIEYLDTRFSGSPRLIPEDRDQARQTRFLDRMADLYLNDNVTTLLFQSWKPEKERNPEAIERARFQMGVVYDDLERRLEGKVWMLGPAFTMADCSAAPPLFYAQKIFPFSDRPRIQTYWQKLRQRPSYLKIEAEALPVLDRLMAARA